MPNMETLADLRTYTAWLLEQDSATESDFWTSDMIDGFIVAEHRVVTTQINHAYEEFFTNLSTTDIVANQTNYGLPEDFRTLIRMEYTNGTTPVNWVEVAPISVQEKNQFWVPNGVVPSGDLSTRISYYFLGSQFVLTPYFNAAVTDGIQLYYSQRLYTPTQAVDEGEYNSVDLWVPFNGLLKDHHEILCMGACVRAKMREEVEHGQFIGTYNKLYKLLIDDIEQRQVQRSKHVRETEGYYGDDW